MIKSMIMALTLMAAFTTNAAESCDKQTRSAHNYKCIAQQLEMYNSDIYYNLSVEEIDQLLAGTRFTDGSAAARFAAICDAN